MPAEPSWGPEKPVYAWLRANWGVGIWAGLAILGLLFRWWEQGAWQPAGLALLLFVVASLIPDPRIQVLRSLKSLLAGSLTVLLWWASVSFSSRKETAMLAGAAALIFVFALVVDVTAAKFRDSWMLTISALLGALLALASTSAGAADPMIQWFIHSAGFSPEAAEITTIVLRKAIHFTYFGLIALFAFKGALGLSPLPDPSPPTPSPFSPSPSSGKNGEGASETAIPQNRNSAVPVPHPSILQHFNTSILKRSALFALLWTASFAAYDELSQLSSPGRTGSAADFLIDILGATVFVTWAAKRLEPTRMKRSRPIE